MWSSNRRRVPAAPDEGMQVVALGQVTMYAARGDVQFSVMALDAVGDGLWRKAFEATRARLEADGLLDPARRRPLPRFPRRVTIITSADGAALHDIVSVVRRRAPAVELVLVPATVQGDGASESLRRALARVAAWGAEHTDVVIIGRGGGSREDLWAFNDEALARDVAAFPIPVISAVGHEVDITLCDLVADLRAATPSAAAEAAVPVWDDVRAHVRRLGDVLCARASGRMRAATEAMARTARRLDAGATRIVDRRRLELASAGGRLDALSPLATLRRGYAVARRDSGAALRSVAEVSANDALDVVVLDGTVHARVEGTTSDTHAWPDVRPTS
jgi:exodeoxyribonuclease VII large subunit